MSDIGKIRVLVLGGTTEARELAQHLAHDARYDATLSLAGRTVLPVVQPVPVRIGGFGGVEGLRDYLRTHRIDLLIDATHPFAARISANAVKAVEHAGVPLISLRRPRWHAEPEDHWRDAPTPQAAIEMLGENPQRVFLTIGRQEAHVAEIAPQHFYLVRSVDPIEPPLCLPHWQPLLDRGPFALESEIHLLQTHRIETVISKNSGGTASYAKIIAARQLALPVIMIEPPVVTARAVAQSVSQALSMINHHASLALKRGV